MDSAQAVLWAASIAACASVSGFLLNQWLARRERKAKAFADALTAMRRYQNFPFRVWQRSTADAATRDRFSKEQSTIGVDVRFHLVWLQIDSPVAGEAYEALWNAVYPRRLDNRHAAWKATPHTCDEGMGLDPPFHRHLGQPETALCIRAMRNELSIMAPLHRRALRREIRDHVQTMAAAPP
jgi:hypothetical protein